ncbi:MAG: tyrosine-type recombinase/integrase [Lachnospiraceae bacterium]
MKNNFPEFLTTFFNQYMELEKGLSENTIASYSDSFLLFFSYYRDAYGLSPDKITFQEITGDRVVDFCKWLEYERNSSIKTRNLRLTAIHSFFRYVEMHAPSELALCKDILGISMKKCKRKPPVQLSDTELKLLFAEPDIKEKKGIRDLCILTVLYDTGARVSELITLKTGDIRLDKNTATVRLLGKGGKMRIVPISSATANIIKVYYKSNGKDLAATASPVFTNNRGETLTRPGINYILDKYVQLAREHYPDKFNSKVTAHVMRHSKATNLLLSDINLVYIRDFLGHASVITTELYAKTNPEFLRHAIEKNAKDYSTGLEYYSQKEKDNLTEFLRGFRK